MSASSLAKTQPIKLTFFFCKILASKPPLAKSKADKKKIYIYNNSHDKTKQNKPLSICVSRELKRMKIRQTFFLKAA